MISMNEREEKKKNVAGDYRWETTNTRHVKSNNIAKRSFLQLMLVMHVNSFFFIYLSRTK